MSIVINGNNKIIGDLTTVFTEVAGGTSFVPPSPKTPIGVSLKLVSGTTVTGRLEGSNDNVNWGTLQTADTTVTTIGVATNVTIVNFPFAYIRYNVTGITGTALALINCYNN